MIEEQLETTASNSPLYSPIENEAWQRFIALRDADAFAAIVRAYYGLVYSVCRRALGGNLTDVDDAVQETFIKLSVNAESIKTNLASWLHSCALNTACELVRKDQSRRRRETKWSREKNRRREVASDAEIPRNHNGDLDEAIESLGSTDRTLVIEHFLVGRSQTELARELGITPSAVSRRLANTLERLRNRLAQVGVTVTASTLASQLTSGTAKAMSTVGSIPGIAESVLLASGGTNSTAASWLTFGGKLSAKAWMVIGTVMAILSVASLVGYFVIRPPTPSIMLRGPLVVTGGHPIDSLGQAVALSGPHLLVGAPTDDNAGAKAGAFYAFRHDGTNWVQSQKIVSPEGAHSTFGGTISIDGNVAAIGIDNDVVPAAKIRRAGKVHLYQYESDHWIHEQTLGDDGTDKNNRFGSAVAVSEGHLLIGAKYDDDRANNAGAVYAYCRVDGIWTPTQKLLPRDDYAAAGFGWFVAMEKSWAIVGAPGDDEDGDSAGAVYVFRWSDGKWQAYQKLRASDGAAGRVFGGSIALDANTLVVGAPNRASESGGPGAVYIFDLQNGRWVERQKLVALDRRSRSEPLRDVWEFQRPRNGRVKAQLKNQIQRSNDFGDRVSLDGDVLVVGARLDSSVSLPEAGAAYVFRKRWGMWVESQILRPTTAERYAAFGDAVSVSDGRIVVGCAGGYCKDLSSVESQRLNRELKSGKTPVLSDFREKPGRAYSFDVE